MGNRSIIGGSAASYVKTSSTGFLQRVVGSNAANDDGSHVRFPIGRSNYNPAHLYNTGTDDKFSLRVYDIVSDNADENGTMTTLPVVERTWLVEEETIGGSSVDMKLYWNGTLENRVEELNSFDYTTAYIAHFNSAQSAWEDKGGSAPGGPGYAQTNNISNFSPFTISSGDAGLGRYSPLPVVLTKFETNCQEDNSIEIVWQTASEQNSDYFLLEKSIDGIEWWLLKEVKSAGNSTESIDYSVVDYQKMADKNVYYRLTQVDFDGTAKVYDIINTNCDETNEENFIISLPNPSSTSFTIHLNNLSKKEGLSLSILDTKGIEVFRKELEIISNENIINVDAPTLVTGIYFIKIDGIDAKVIKHAIK